MTPSKIIREDALNRNIDPEKVINNVAKLVKSGKATLLHSGKTVLLLVRFSQEYAELHLFTQDAPLSLMTALRRFVDTIRKTNLDAVYGKADNEGILAMLRRVGVDVEKSNMPQYNWMAKI
jgi:hypothetical protein